LGRGGREWMALPISFTGGLATGCIGPPEPSAAVPEPSVAPSGSAPPSAAVGSSAGAIKSAKRSKKRIGSALGPTSIWRKQSWGERRRRPQRGAAVRLGRHASVVAAQRALARFALHHRRTAGSVGEREAIDGCVRSRFLCRRGWALRPCSGSRKSQCCGLLPGAEHLAATKDGRHAQQFSGRCIFQSDHTGQTPFT
jgi:hypothetical protein